MNTAAGESYSERVRYYRRKADQERAAKKRANWFNANDEQDETTIDFEEALYNFKESSGFDKMYSRAKRGAKRQAREHLAFYRDDEQGYLGGVCAGIADKMNWDVTMVRVVTVLLGLVLTLPTLITYIAATFVLRKKNLAFYGRDEKGFWRSASRREQAPYPQHDATFTDEENE